MSEWKEVKLVDLTNRITKGTTPSTYGFEYTKEGINYIRAEGISKDGYVDESTFYKISVECHEKLKRSQLKENDILFSIAGMALGKTGLVKKEHLPANTNQAVAIISYDEKKVIPKFLLYHFINPHFYKIVNSVSGQAAQPNINLEQVGDLKILLPPLPTQQRIASILSAYDDLIENNLKRIKLLEEIAQRTYEEWFIKFRINGVQLEVGENGLPEGWEEKTIGEFIKFYKGKKADSIQPNYEIGLERLLLLDGIESGNYPYTNPDKQVIAEQNDLLMLMDGARSSKVFFAEKGVVGSTLSKIEIVEPKLSSSLLKLFFDNNFDWMQTNNTGAAIPHANKNFINSMPFNLPTDKILMDWKNKIETLYSNIRNMKNQNRLLKESRDILLPRLMSGKVGV
jgi:type I restriction enzyme S subunit